MWKPLAAAYQSGHPEISHLLVIPYTSGDISPRALNLPGREPTPCSL
ncbi:hypothetical protein LEMLEM_LOCUS19230 [Lemmus lemmus]